MTSILLENIPPDLLEKLQLRAEARQSSIGCEALACLEAALRPGKDLRAIRISNDSLWEARHSDRTP